MEQFDPSTWSMSSFLFRQAIFRPISSVSFIPSIHSIVSTALRVKSQYIFGTFIQFASLCLRVFPALAFGQSFFLSPVNQKETLTGIIARRKYSYHRIWRVLIYNKFLGEVPSGIAGSYPRMC